MGIFWRRSISPLEAATKAKYVRKYWAKDPLCTLEECQWELVVVDLGQAERNKAFWCQRWGLIHYSACTRAYLTVPADIYKVASKNWLWRDTFGSLTTSGRRTTSQQSKSFASSEGGTSLLCARKYARTVCVQYWHAHILSVSANRRVHIRSRCCHCWHFNIISNLRKCEVTKSCAHTFICRCTNTRTLHNAPSSPSSQSIYATINTDTVNTLVHNITGTSLKKSIYE